MPFTREMQGLEPYGMHLERRRQTRYGIRAPVDFRWTDNTGVVLYGRGFTRDISSKGVFVHADLQPPAMADIQIEVLFVSLTELGSRLRMKARAQVVRVEPHTTDETGGGFAVFNRSYELHNGVTAIED